MALAHLFFDDYSEGAHPRILEALSRTNLQPERGYGADSFAKQAERLIQSRIENSQAHVHFVSSGTLANLICLASMLRPHESVIAPDHGHAHVHETGAIEATGHKINVAPGDAGKLTPEAIAEVVSTHSDEYMVKPRVVYISQATELGTVYRLKELQELRAACQAHGLYLYIDGARLGNALMSQHADFDLREIARVCDMFNIGGTKNGALIGEAVVIVNTALQTDFRYHMRQRGGLLAKARAVSVQFAELFQDDLYLENARHANAMAARLAAAVEACGYTFLNPPATNQIFPVLPDAIVARLEKTFGFYVWSKAPDAPNHSVVRLVTSWATTEVATQDFADSLKQLS